MMECLHYEVNHSQEIRKDQLVFMQICHGYNKEELVKSRHVYKETGLKDTQMITRGFGNVPVPKCWKIALVNLAF